MPPAIKEKLGIVGSIWAMTFRTLRRYPVIIVPFLIVALLEAIALTLSYLAPRPPLSAILAPPIRALFKYGGGNGEPYLHYPINFLLLPKLLLIGQITIGATVGVVLTALAIRMIAQANEGNSPSWGTNLRDAFFRYFTLLVIWGVIFFLETVASRGLARIFSGSSFRQVIFYISLGIVMLIETFFAYAVIAVMLENRRAWRAIVRTFSVTKSLFFPTFILVFTPLLFQILFVIVRGKIPQLMVRFSPEITLLVLGLGITIGFITDCVIRTSTVILFLVKRDTERTSS